MNQIEACLVWGNLSMAEVENGRIWQAQFTLLTANGDAAYNVRTHQQRNKGDTHASNI